MYTIVLLLLLLCFWGLSKIWLFKKAFLKLKNFLLWGPVLRLIQEGYLEFAIVCLMNIDFYKLQESSLHNSISFVFCLFLFAILIAFPIFIIIFLVQVSEDRLINDKAFKKKYGEIFNGLKL